MTLADHHAGGDVDPGQGSLPLIAAVIPALNEAPSIARVVEGLRDQVLLATGDVIVVDNGSTDGTAEISRRSGARVVSVVL